MTTITIERPLRLKKTHFVDALEAAYALMGEELNNHDDDFTRETFSNVLAYEASLEGGNETFSLSQAKKIVL